jgi:hypothetical protein
VLLNGAPLTNQFAFTDAGMGLIDSAVYTGTNGYWFVMQELGGPNGTATYISEVVLQGTCMLDDFIVTTNVPSFVVAGGTYTVIIAQPVNGSISPAGPFNGISSGGSTPLLTNTPNANFYHVDWLITNAVAQGDYDNVFQLTGITSNDEISVTIAADTGGGLTNGVTESWLQAQGIYTNDYVAAATNDPDGDGFSTSAEYLTSSDPNDPAKSFRISFSDADGTMKWITWDPNATDLPAFAIEWTDNLTNSTWNHEDTVTRTDGVLVTNTWSGPGLNGNDQRYYRVVATNAP